MSGGHYGDAVSAFGRALAATQDPAQKDIALYALAMATSSAGDTLAAIPMLKQVAADTIASSLTRAYAAQGLGQIANNNTFSPRHQSIMAEIFKDEPYKDMLVAGDEALSIRHVFDYASSIYPLAISELRIADWYMKALQFNNLSTTTDPGRTYVAIAQEKMQSADLDVLRTTNLPTRSMIPTALSSEAVVGGELALAGVVSPYGAAQLYQQAIDSFSTYDPLPGHDSTVRFNYAGFLALVWGTARAADIHSAISPLYLDPAAYTGSALLHTLTSLASMPSTDMGTTTAEIIMLRAREIAVNDAGFRNLLMGLGWRAGEFEQVPKGMTN